MVEICKWQSEDCADCKGTMEEFMEDCRLGDFFIDMAWQCPQCVKGIINPTFNKTMACDKCTFEKPVTEEDFA